MPASRRADEDLYTRAALGPWEPQARHSHVAPGSLDSLTAGPPAGSRPQTLPALGLTRRQAEVLQLLWRGSTNADIARTLSISEHTVRHHLEDIYKRLGVKSRVGAAHVVTMAIANSLGLE